MRVTLVNTYHFAGGGDCTYTYNLFKLLQEKKHDVSIFAMKYKEDLEDPNVDLFVSNIDYHELNQRKNLLTGLTVMYRSVYSLEARKKFRKLLIRAKTDIIHLNSIHHHITPSIIFEAEKLKLPVVWTLHDFKLLCPNTHFLVDNAETVCEACKSNRYYKSFIKRCKKNSYLASMIITLEAYIHRILGVRNKVDYFISPSLFLKEKLLEYGFDKKKVLHIPHFIPKHYFKKSIDSSNYFLYLGRLSKIKGIDILIEACRTNPDFQLIIAGDGNKEYKNTLLANLPPNVKYVGPQSREKIHGLISKAKAVILPSLCYENQPFCILEAFAHAKPTIASNLGGIAELVGINERGILVPPGDSKALADAMLWILTNESKARELGENAYNYALQEHSEEIHYTRLYTVYEMAINKKNTA
ncbi:MAG: glycosyltransferase family 4 protein [candidate division WOR-3 bacterium]|nr:glycosyltransferase family 4 protein [candidate division WOR-3 bacterium]